MSDELATIATYPQATLAHAAKNFLAEHGIRAFVADEYMAVQNWPNLIEAKLQVSAVDADRAKSLLATADHS
jgi:hypothetical protein